MKGYPAGATMVHLLATVLLVAPLHLLLAARQEDACRFPGKWQGTWFQSGFRQPILIDGSRLSTKGQCISAEGDKFVVVDDKGCYRCVVIHEKHANVLQYKETYCHTKDQLSTLCSLITGDALLFSMFRIEAHPVACPFKGPFTFTYNRGHGDCRSPVSSIDSCTEESRLLLSYQACPDVHGTESTVEELQCLATWKEGSSRYLVGKVTHNHATSSEDRYRCFVYEKATLNNDGVPKGPQEYGQIEEVRDELGVDYRIAQSGDATCNGLSSPMEGSRTMTLKRASTPSKCRFPTWLTSSTHWHTLDYTRDYSFHHHHNTTLRIANTTAKQPIPQQQQQQQQGVMSLGLTSHEDSQPEKRVVCTEIKQVTQDVAKIVTHFTMGCQSGFVCMVFYRRDGHVIEVQTGAHVRRAEDACHSTHFNRTSQPFVTLVTSSPEPRQCPHLGKFSVTGVTRDDDHLFRSTRSNQFKTPSLESIVKSRTMQRYHKRSIPDTDPKHNDIASPHQEESSDFKTKKEEEDDKDKMPESHESFYNGGNRFKRSNLDRQSNDPCGQDSEDFTSLVVGCSTMDTMEFRSECPAIDVVSAYSCHGRWEDNGTNYLITTPLSRSSHGARRYCFMYREVDGVVHFSSSSDSCQRNISPGVGGALAFNVTSSGQCVEANTASQINHTGFFLICLLSLLATQTIHIQR